MPIFKNHLPLSLYIHLPWCIRKCPYCDFNSHSLKENLPELAYVNALISDLNQHLPLIKNRPIQSIFFGGGTPSLFSATAIDKILKNVRSMTDVLDNAEITLEANPGTIEAERFHGYKAAGVNRLSIGIQSFNDTHLKVLGRIHSSDEAKKAIEIAITAGFHNFNLDLMYGLPAQTIEESLSDLKTAIQFSPTHLSWYQLTLEPNTLFAYHPPKLPCDDELFEIQVAGQQFLSQEMFKQYEVSAYVRDQLFCKHNLNYWEFGDYLGIGAGAHSKITDIETNCVKRFAQVKHPKDYLDAKKRSEFAINVIQEKDLIFEFMLNALRLTDGFAQTLFSERTGISFDVISEIIAKAQMNKLIDVAKNQIKPSEKGKQFLNDVVAMFL